MSDPDASPYNRPPATPSPVGYASGNYESARSAIPRVLGIIGVIYAVIGLLLRGLTLVATVALRDQNEAAGNYSSTQYAADLAMNGLFLLMALLLMVASIQLIRYKRIGATLGTMWATLSLLLLVVFSIVMLALMLPNVTVPPAQQGNISEGAYKASFVGGLIIVNLIRCILPVVFLVLLRKRSAQDALED